MPAGDLLALLLESSETDGISKALVESLTSMVDQLGAAQKAAIKKENDRNDARVSKMLRAMERMAREGNLKYDPLAEFGEDGDDGDGDARAADRFHDNPRDSGV